MIRMRVPAEFAARVAEIHQMCLSGEAREIRTRAGATLTQVARLVDTSESCVHSWETGKSRPKDESALRYGRVLDELRQPQSVEQDDQEAGR